MRIRSWPASLVALLAVVSSSCGLSPQGPTTGDQKAQDERPVIQTLTKEQLTSCPGGFGSFGTLDYITAARGAASPLQAARGLVDRGRALNRVTEPSSRSGTNHVPWS